MSEIQEKTSPPLSNRSSTSADTLLEDFAALRKAIFLDGLITIASRIRGVGCTVDVENPFYGSFNLIYAVTFLDGVKWAARIPLHGVKESFHDSDAKALKSQALTMRFIKQNTSIPVPDVIHFDTTFDNALGAPFLLITWLEGIPIYSAWRKTSSFDDHTILDERREKMLRSVGKVMAQLRFLSAPKLGELDFEPTNDTNEKLRVKDFQYMHSLHLEEHSEDVMFSDIGPFDHTRDFLSALEKDSIPDRPLDDFARGQRELLKIMIDSIPVVEHEKFVLVHPDFDSQNFLVNEEGTVTGVLDWDGVSTYPRYIGYSRYPGWLTRDWDPLIYNYGENRIPDGKEEDSPETLRKLRKMYFSIMQEELGEDEAKWTINSHLFEAIEIAARNPMNSSSIITLLLSVALGKGDLAEEKINILKEKFREALACTTHIIE
ncbi:kinase-like domain-containing protein [Gymnopilus junonius]|uniref:Kinase-like domain-containing protein n=1 Tax=Gymnopilus junonius TaxID=109634 RepID=A0A9P5NU49_GYMJU|nr:kinase-like domain-containing protein [Gymnopilus junonius]